MHYTMVVIIHRHNHSTHCLLRDIIQYLVVVVCAMHYFAFIHVLSLLVCCMSIMCYSIYIMRIVSSFS